MIDIMQLQKVVQQNTLIDVPELNAAAGSITAVSSLTPPHKETFIQLLTGQTAPTAGHIRLDSIDPFKDRVEFAQRVGFLPAEDGLYERLTVRQNLEFYCRLYGLPLSHAAAMLSQVGLQDKAQIRVEQLSPELARRLALGRALLHQPQILILVDLFHRSYLVNLQHIKEMIAYTRDSYTLILDGNQPDGADPIEIPLSKTAARDLRELLDF